jgi:hypothetical protein
VSEGDSGMTLDVNGGTDGDGGGEDGADVSSDCGGDGGKGEGEGCEIEGEDGGGDEGANVKSVSDLCNFSLLAKSVCVHGIELDHLHTLFLGLRHQLGCDDSSDFLLLFVGDYFCHAGYVLFIARLVNLVKSHLRGKIKKGVFIILLTGFVEKHADAFSMSDDDDDECKVYILTVTKPDHSKVFHAISNKGLVSCSGSTNSLLGKKPPSSSAEINLFYLVPFFSKAGVPLVNNIENVKSLLSRLLVDSELPPNAFSFTSTSSSSSYSSSVSPSSSSSSSNTSSSTSSTRMCSSNNTIPAYFDTLQPSKDLQRLLQAGQWEQVILWRNGQQPGIVGVGGGGGGGGGGGAVVVAAITSPPSPAPSQAAVLVPSHPIYGKGATSGGGPTVPSVPIQVTATRRSESSKKGKGTGTN